MKLEKYLLTILRVGVFLVFLTPLIYTGSTIFPFIFGKTLYFRGAVEILFVLYLLLILAFPKYRPKNSLLLTAILIYFFIDLLALIFSVDRTRSFWSNHERMMGYFTYLHALGLLIIASSVFRDREDWKKVFIASTIVSFVLNSLGFYQYLQKGTFLHSVGGGQVYSTLGNFIYLGGYCLWHIFIACAYLLKSRVHLAERLFWIFSLSVNAVGLVLAGSRGPFLGVFIGIIMGAFLYAVFSRAKKVRISLGLLLLIIAAISSLIWFNKSSDFVKGNRYLARFTDISFVTATGSTRVLNWGVAWEAFKDRPILGWGPDNYYIAFNKHFNPKFYEFGQYETWQDHAHNVIFDTLNESGILGLLSYLFVFLAFYATLWKALRNKANQDISLIIFPGIAATAYFIQNLFVFDTLTILMLFYVILGFVHSSYGSPEGGELKIVDEQTRLSVSKEKGSRESASTNGVDGFWQKLDPVYRGVIITGLIIPSLFIVYYLNVGPFKASRLTIKALRTYQSNFYQGYEIFKKALSIWSPYSKETRDEFSKVIIMLGNAKTGLTKDELKSYFNDATAELSKTKTEHPKDVYIHMYLTQWYANMAMLFEDVNYLNAAEEEIKTALSLSPKRQQVNYTAAQLYQVGGDYKEAERILLQTVEFNPKIGDTYWYLAALYAKTGEKDKVLANVEKSLVLAANFAPMSNDLVNTLRIVVESTTSTKTLDWYLSRAASARLDANGYLAIAKAYKRLGDFEKMKQAISLATSTDPGKMKEAEEMLK